MLIQASYGYVPTTQNIIVGASYKNQFGQTIEVSDTLVGTSRSDLIFAGGGDDHVYAGYGDDNVNGGAGVDWLYPYTDANQTAGYWGHDVVHGGTENDHIIYGYTMSDVDLYGDEGSDEIRAGSGNDHLFGGPGNDTLDAGFGNDIVDGGTGAQDLLWGGANRDVFAMRPGENAWIMDWNAAEDRVGIPASFHFEDYFSHYTEAYLPGISAAGALSWANQHMGGPSGNVFAFVTNGSDAWLMADFNLDRQVDTAMMFPHASTINHFGPGNLTII